MPPIEELLRAELKRVADSVRPAQLRPLLAPAPGARRWRARLVPAVAALAVAAVAAVVSLTGVPSGLGPAGPGASAAAMPRYYVAVGGSVADVHAVVHKSASGQVTGTVPVPTGTFADRWSVTAAADGRMFVIVLSLGTSHLAGTGSYQFYRLPVSPAGRPGRLTKLPLTTGGDLLTGAALSPDGSTLALSMEHAFPADEAPYGHLAIVNLATGRARSWTGAGAPGFWPGTPTWSGDGRTLTLPWWHQTSQSTGATALAGIRQLDTAAPGQNLLASRLTSFPAPDQGLASAVIATGGTIFASSCGDTSGTGSYHGTAVARILELSAADGRLLGVLHTQTERFPHTADEQDAVSSACAVLSVDPSGRHLLVQAFEFGRIGNGVFTPLPGTSPDVLFAAAAW